MLSLITATYNSAATVALTFESILNQTYKEPFEYIVMDGASKDDTVAIIKVYEQKFLKRGITFKWVSEKDNGIYDAWNKAIKLTTGKWIGFIGSDDIYQPNALETYANHMIKKPELDYLCSHVEVIINNKTAAIIHIDTFKDGRLKNLAHVGSFHNREYFTKYNTFNLKYKVVGDYELLLRKNNLNYMLLPDVLVKMGYGGVSTKMIFKTIKEVRDVRLAHGFKISFVNRLYRKEMLQKAITYSFKYIFGESLITTIKSKLVKK